MQLPFNITLEEYLSYQKFTFEGYYVEQPSRAELIAKSMPGKWHIEPTELALQVKLWRLDDWNKHYAKVMEDRRRDLAGRKIRYSMEIRRETLERAICNKMQIDLNLRSVPIQVKTLCEALAHLSNEALAPVLSTYGIAIESFQAELTKEEALEQARKELSLGEEVINPVPLVDSPNMQKYLADKRKMEERLINQAKDNK